VGIGVFSELEGAQKIFGGSRRVHFTRGCTLVFNREGQSCGVSPTRILVAPFLAWGEGSGFDHPFDSIKARLSPTPSSANSPIQNQRLSHVGTSTRGKLMFAVGYRDNEYMSNYSEVVT
jgi:hypothetical protein